MTEELEPRRFDDTDLRGARFDGADLTGAVMRGVQLGGADLDAPWLVEEGSSLLVNGVDVVPLVDAELDRRYPGRALRRPTDVDGLRAAWAAVEAAWLPLLDRAAALPEGAVNTQVAGEWSFAQTLRHLVMATDTWLGRAVLGRDLAAAYHPFGQPNREYATDGYDTSVFATEEPSYDQVLEARADRQRMVREHLAALQPDDLAGERVHPWGPDHRVSTLHCLRVILDEEWEHLRYADRDLAVLEGGSPVSP